MAADHLPHPRHASFSGPRRLLGLSTFSPSLRPRAWLWTQPSLAGSVTSVSASQFCPWPLWTWSFLLPWIFSKASFQVEISQSSLGLPACEPSSHPPLHLRWAGGEARGGREARVCPRIVRLGKAGSGSSRGAGAGAEGSMAAERQLGESACQAWKTH